METFEFEVPNRGKLQLVNLGEHFFKQYPDESMAVKVVNKISEHAGLTVELLKTAASESLLAIID